MAKSIIDLARKRFVSISSALQVGSALSRVKKHGLPGLVVTEKGVIKGVITKSLLDTLPPTQKLCDSPLQEADCLPESMGVKAAASLIGKQPGIRPVVDGHGQLKGLLDLEDVRKYLLKNGKAKPSSESKARPDIILIADDSRIVRSQLVAVLKRNGYQTETASNGVEALKKIRELNPGLIILDIKMPKMDGYQVLAEVRKDSELRKIPVVMLTALGETGARIKAFEMGADDYLLKPFNPRELEIRVRRLLQASGEFQIKEQEKSKAEQALKEAGHVFQALLEASPDGIAIMDLEFKYVFVSDRLAQLHGFEGPEHMIGRYGLQFLATENSEQTEIFRKRLLEEGVLRDSEIKLTRRDGSEFFAEIDTALIKDGSAKPRGYISIVRDISERKQAEDMEKLVLKILEVLDRFAGRKDIIRELLLLIKEHTGMEAVGIRLKEGEDYPYYESNGFARQFIEAENYLCERDSSMDPVRDAQGDAALECMCGNVIRGRVDPQLPFFTEGGSFWTNGSTQLLATTTEKQRQSRTRNRCNAEGYESVALIPLRYGEETIGLLQLNDHRPDRFNPKMIKFFERIGSSAGIAVSRMRAEEAIRESEIKYRSLMESSSDHIFMLDLEGKYISSNAQVERFGLENEKSLLGLHLRQVYSPEVYPLYLENFNQVLATGKPATFEHILKTHSGVEYHIDTIYPVLREGKLWAVGGICHNITDLEIAQQALWESEERFRCLFEKSAEALLLIDLQAKVVDCNDAFLRFFAVKDKSEVLGHSPAEFAPEYQPDGTPSRDMGNLIFAQVKEKGAAQFEWAHLKHDPGRTPVICELLATAIVIRGQTLLHMAIRDITARKRVQELLTIQHELAMAMSSETGLEQTLKIGVESAIKASGLDCGGIYLINDDTGSLELAYSQGLTEQFIKHASVFEANSQSSRLVMEGNAVYSRYLKLEVKIDPVRAAEGLRASAILPIKHENKVIACLNIASHFHDKITAYSRMVIETVAAQIGIFILRAKAIDALTRSEKKYQELVENANSIILRMAPDGVVTYFNEFAQKFFGYAGWEILGKNVIGTIVPETDSSGRDLAQMIREIGENPGRFQNNENENMRRNGERVWVAWTNRLLLDDQGRVKEILCVGNDLTDRRQAERSLRTAHQQFADMMEFLPDATFVVDLQGTVIAWNRAMEELTGVAKENMLGKSDYAYSIPIYGNPRPILIDLVLSRDQVIMKEYKAVRQKGEALYSEVFAPALYGGKGAFLWFTASPLYDAEGELAGAIESIRDITERKQAEKALSESEERYRIITDNMSDTVWLVDMNFMTTYISPSVVRTRGFTLEELQAMPLEKNFSPSSMQIVAQVMAEELTPERLGQTDLHIERTRELAFSRKDNSFFWNEVTLTLVRDQEGKPVGIVGVGRDITAKKRAEELADIQHDLALFLSSTTSLAESLTQCLEAAIQVSGLDCGGIYLVDQDTGDLKLMVHKGLSPEYIKKASYYPSHSPNTVLIKQGKPIYSILEEVGVPKPEAIVKEGIHAIAIIPFVYEEEVIGCMNVASHTMKEIAPEAKSALETIGAQVGSAIARMQAQDALAASEMKYRLLLESAQEGVWVSNSKFETMFVNKRMAEILGYAPEEMIGRPGADFIDETSQLTFKEHQEYRRQGIKEEYDMVLVKKNGTKVYARISAAPVNENTEFEGSIALVSDITLAKHAEEALQTSEKKYRELVELGQEGIWTIDQDSRTSFVNPRMAEMLGYTVEEMIGKHLFEFMDQEGVAIAEMNLERRRQGIKEQHTFQFLRKDGQRIYAILDSSPIFDAQGRYAGAIAAVMDITMRKLAEDSLRDSEDRFRQMAENSPFPISIIDAAGNYQYINNKFTEVFGYTLEDVPTGRHWFNLAFPDLAERKRAVSCWKNDLPEPGRVRQFSVTCKDGRARQIVFRPATISGNRQFVTYEDVTERERAANALRESEEKYRTLVETLRETITRIDLPSGKYTYVSPAAREVFGYLPEDFLNNPLFIGKILHPDSREYHKNMWPALLKGKVPDIFEYKIIDPEGKSRWIRQSNKGIFGKDGKIIGMEGLCRNVTEEYEAREALKESEEKFSTAFHSSPFIMVLIDLESKKFIDINQTAVKIFGTERADIIGHLYEKFDFISDPARREIFMDTVLSKGQIRDFETGFRIKPGKEIVGRISVEPLRIHGRNCALLVIEDITEHKQAEDALRKEQEEGLRLKVFLEDVMDDMMTGLLVYDLEGRIRIVNRRGKDILHVEKDIEGTLIQDHFPVLGLTQEQATETELGYETSIKLADGTQVPIGYSINPMEDGQGLKIGKIVVFQDLTEIKTIREQLRIREKFAIIGEIARGVAHEIKNPLFAISSGIQLLEREMDMNPDQKETVGIIMDEAFRMNRLIQQLLSFTAKPELIISPLKIEKLANNVISLCRGLLKAKELQVKTGFDENLPEMLLDRDKITQVLINILINAIEASPKGAEIEISAALDRDRKKLLLRIKDQGPGIREDQRDKIFDLFFTTKQSNFGIGLAICKRIVLDHNGNIYLDPEKKPGTTMVMELPIEEENEHNPDRG